MKIEGKLDALVNAFKFSHKFVEKLSIRYLKELNRHNYVTPTSYLELLNLYKGILEEKNELNHKMIMRLANGLDKLNAANVSVEEMKVKLTDM